MGLKLMAELGLDGSGFDAGFKHARGVAEGVAEGLKNVIVGAIGVVTVEEALRKTVETARELVDESERLSIAPEQLQVLRQAAKNANLDFEKLVETMEKLAVARERALIPGKEGLDSRRAFASFGVGNDQLKSLTTGQLLLGPLRDAVLGRNPEEIGIIFRELGIKAFGGLIPVLKTNFDELEAKMKKIGAIMDSDTAVKLKAVSDELSFLSQIIASQLGPALVTFGEMLYKLGLQGLGKLAGGSAALGAMTANQSVFETFTSSFSAFGHMVSRALGFMSASDFEKKMAPLFDWQAGENAAKGAIQPWEKKVKEFQDMLKQLQEEAERLKHPKPPDLSQPTIPEKLSRKALEQPTDTLVRIGNFLGGSQLAINRIAERQVYWLEKIARNTEHNHTNHDAFRINSGFSSQMGPHFPHS